MTDKKIDSLYVYGLCNIYYDAFYIKGLQDFFDIKNVEFDIRRFPKFRQNTFAVIISSEGKSTKMIIDSRDSASIFPIELNWCDVYGKVNYNTETLPQDQNQARKIVPIGPSFGIRIWDFSKTIRTAVKNAFRFYPGIPRTREFFANYWRQNNRLRLEDYANDVEVSDKYVFFMAAIWQKEAQTNLFRLNFIKACKNNQHIEFEGGFAQRKDGNNFGFETNITKTRYPLAEYMQKIKKSAIVFNTPAVLSCHGWKLGEFLAMGKAIVSTAHTNVLPAPLDEGINIIYVDGNEPDSYQQKINELLASDAKRNLIGKNAKLYFETFLAPEKIIEKLYTQARK